MQRVARGVHGGKMYIQVTQANKNKIFIQVKGLRRQLYRVIEALKRVTADTHKQLQHYDMTTYFPL